MVGRRTRRLLGRGSRATPGTRPAATSRRTRMTTRITSGGGGREWGEIFRQDMVWLSAGGVHSRRACSFLHSGSYRTRLRAGETGVLRKSDVHKCRRVSQHGYSTHKLEMRKANSDHIRACQKGCACLGYRGSSLIRCGDSENGRWHVLNFKNVLEKRSAVRSSI